MERTSTAAAWPDDDQWTRADHMEVRMNLLLWVSAILFTLAALIVGTVNHDLIGALILGGIAAYVAAGAGVPAVTPRG